VIDDLSAEFVRYLQAFQRYEAFSRREVSGFMREWWRIDPIEDVDRVRRRANRQRNLALHHLGEMKDSLVARGPEGIEAIKAIFLTRDPDLVCWLHDVVVAHFPDEAEPVLEEMLALPDEFRTGLEYRWRFEEAITMIQGYRARRARSLAPELSAESGPDLAPALATLDKSPAEFPDLLFERFAAWIFSGELAFHAAVQAAWKQVVAEKRLDSVYHEHAELAEFDPKYRNELAGVIHERYGKGIYPDRLADYGFAYRHEDGSPVTLEELQEAIYHVVRMTNREPYQPATAWTGGVP
jgi:hypothetical protein